MSGSSEMWKDIVSALGLEEVGEMNEIEEMVFPEVLDLGENALGNEELVPMQVDDVEFADLDRLINEVDTSTMLEFLDVEVEDFFNLGVSGEQGEKVAREFLDHVEVRDRLEPLLRDEWCSLPWEPRPCEGVYKIDVYGNDRFLPPWWKLFP